MYKAEYYQKGDSIDYTPEANVAAGDVVFLGDLVGVAKLDIKAGELGALALSGVYRVVKGSETAEAGAPVYWNSESGQATFTQGSNKRMGTLVADAATDDAVCLVKIN